MNTGRTFVFGLVVLLAVAICDSVGDKVKSGKCPPARYFKPSNAMTTFERCKSDSDCVGNKKCCLDNGYKFCKPPAKERSGNCPPPLKITGTREDMCTSDSECAVGLKCCMGESGLTCTPCAKFPAKPGACKQTDIDLCIIRVRTLCSEDCTCPNTEKCCPNGCSYECQKPV